MNAIEITGLTKHYAGFSLQNLNLTLPQGAILGLAGENGAGKSTTIRLIMNTLSRDSGSIRVLGTDNRSPEFRAVKEDIGIVLDEAFFPQSLTPREVDRILRSTYRRWESDVFFSYLRRFSLPEHKAFQTFSRGMKMKLAIAAALSHQPKLLILDEATSGLDPMVRDERLALFSEFTREEDHAILLSSHIISDLEKLCDYIAFLHQGRLMLFEEKDRLMEEYAILKLTTEELEAVPPEAIQCIRENAYGAEVLVRRAEVSPGFRAEHATLEDIILFLARKECHQ